MKTSSFEDKLAEKCIEKFKIYKRTTLEPSVPGESEKQLQANCTFLATWLMSKMISEPAIPSFYVQLEAVWPSALS